MTEKEKLAMLEDLLDVDEGTLSPETSLDEIEEYDSMTKLSLIVMAEDDFGIKLDSATLKSFKTVGDILAVLNK